MRAQKRQQNGRNSDRFWQVKNLAGNGAELVLYGTISDTSWYGDEVTPKQFADDIKALGAVENLTVRINSGGGDVFAAQAIGAQLDNLAKAGTKTKCCIDGLCASAATIIASHCTTVTASEGSYYMIHMPSVCLYDAYDEDDLTAYLNELKAVKNSILRLYAKKTGRDMNELEKMMDETSWLTADEAKDYGFVDEVDAGEATRIENRSGALFINSVDMGLALSEAPEFVKNAAERFSDKKTPADAEPENKEETKMAENQKTGAQAAPAINTVDALRAAYPDLCKQIEQAAAQNATNTERARIKDIEDMTAIGAENSAYEAKFGEHPQDAAAYAIAQMKAQCEAGRKAVADAKNDAYKSGVNGVGQATPADDKKDGGEGAFLNAIRRANNVK